MGAKNAVWTVVYMGVTSTNKLNQVKALYPGNAYVDYIAWDPYNWAGCRGQAWQSFAQIVTPFYNWLETHGYGTKPFMLAEFGTVEDPHHPTAKAAWFTGADKSLATGQFPNLKVVSYFDHSASTGSCNWSIATSAASTAAYKTMAHNMATRSTTK
jgi:beta-mannanase